MPRPGRTRKPYRLYKRVGSGNEISLDHPEWKERYYYFRFTFHGKSYARCLETTDANEAQRRARLKAKEIKDLVSRGDYLHLTQTKLRQPVSANINAVAVAYRTAPVDASRDTREQNIHALKLILKRVRGVEDAGPLPVSQVNADLVHKWFAMAGAAAAAETDQRRAASIKRSANSRFAHARSIFAVRAIAAYKEAGLVIPSCVEGFAKGGRLHRFTRLPRSEYNPPADNIIAATLTAWEAIEARDLFLAVGHELAFGLRKGELAQAKWNWWTVRQGYPVLDGMASVKNQSGLVQVRALDPWFTVMKRKAEARGWMGRADDFIIGGNSSNRGDSIFRAVGIWLRGLGWATQKTNHALRAYAGSQIAMKYGIYEAQTWLRHSTVKVTENHYTTYVKRFKPADLEGIAATWATLETAAVALKILSRA